MEKIKKYGMSINNWPQQDRPREKLFKSGEHTLSNSELLAIILRTGTKGAERLRPGEKYSKEQEILQQI